MCEDPILLKWYCNEPITWRVCNLVCKFVCRVYVARRAVCVSPQLESNVCFSVAYDSVNAFTSIVRSRFPLRACVLIRLLLVHLAAVACFAYRIVWWRRSISARERCKLCRENKTYPSLGVIMSLSPAKRMHDDCTFVSKKWKFKVSMCVCVCVCVCTLTDNSIIFGCKNSRFQNADIELCTS